MGVKIHVPIYKWASRPIQNTRQIVETGRVINRRYLLQRLVKQGQYSVVYQGIDQVLQRVVTVKAVPAPHIPVYRAAVKLTASFSHPNIVGLYDLVIEAETLYVVQEYIEGDDFAALLQLPLMPHIVAGIGSQICQALIYAGASSRRVSHGDLTPGAVIRDHTGLVRINNFALPSDLTYFEHWSIMGGGDTVVSDSELPWGTQSEGRRADDTRAVGLLIYQLLASRVPGTRAVEPRQDGRLSFQRNVPPELCETVARAVVRQHPQRICTPEALYTALKALSETLAQPSHVIMPVTSTVYQPPAEPMVISQAASSGTGKLASALPIRDTDQPGLSLPPYRSEQSMQPPLEQISPASPTVADVSLKLAAARQAAYPESVPQRQSRQSLLPILVIGLVVFVLLFIIGYFVGHFLIP